MRSQMPEGFLQSLSRNGFNDLGLTAVSENKIFRPATFSKLHLKNKLKLRNSQQLSVLGESCAKGKGKEKVYAYSPESIADQQMLLEFLQRTHPSSLKSLGLPRDDIADGELLWRLSLSFCDDLCLLRKATKGYRLVAASLCAPSSWSLASMLGKTIAQLHAPVPNLNQERGQGIDRLLSQLSTVKSFQRFNWGLKTTDRLALFPGAERIAPQSFKDIFLRIERQTLTRLSPSTVVFGIEVTVERLSYFYDQEPSLLELLSDAYYKLSDEQIKYKGIAEFGRFL